jgi:hypothetical protein
MYYSPNIVLFFCFVRDIIITTTMLSFNVIKYTGLWRESIGWRCAPPNFYKLANIRKSYKPIKGNSDQRRRKNNEFIGKLYVFVTSENISVALITKSHL